MKVIDNTVFMPLHGRLERVFAGYSPTRGAC
jgi:hypothetical protein